MRATLQHVAERAGVSPKTVSNVANGYPHVRSETRDRVLRAMAELDYRANMSARNLARGRTGIIAFAVPWLSNPYYSDLAGHIITAAQEQSLTVLIDETHADAERERQILAGIGPELLDGVILSPQRLTRQELAAVNSTRPLVLLGEGIFDGPADHVVADNISAARDLTAHLISTGKRRIASIGFSGTELTGTPQLRMQGFREALDDAGIPPREDYQIAVTGYERGDGWAATRTLLSLSEPPDAIVCFNDVVAVGALKCLSDNGCDVPDSIAVAGFDDTQEGAYSVPPLTTVSWENDVVAHQAVRLLQERIGSKEKIAPREVHTGYHLVRRGSTQRNPRQHSEDRSR